MRIVKPRKLSILSRPFEYRRRIFLGVSTLAFIPLDEPPQMLDEQALWVFLGENLPAGVVLDVGIPKRYGEFLVTGAAWPDAAGEQTSVRVGAVCGSVSRQLNVFGDRFLTRDGIVIGPEPFTSLPLNWEHAYGGSSAAENPLGKGVEAVTLKDGDKVTPLPNIVAAKSGADVRMPAGFGPVEQDRPARSRLAGTYDRNWLETDYPGLAKDIDWRFFNIAQPEQQLDGIWKGDEPWQLVGMHSTRRTIEGKLPGLAARCLVRRKGRDDLEDHASQLTTVWFFPDQLHAVLIFHSSIEVSDPDAEDLSELMVAAEWHDRQRPLDHYQDVFDRRVNSPNRMQEKLRDDDLLPEGLATGNLDSIGNASDPDFNIRNRNSRRKARAVLSDAETKIADGMRQLGAEVPERKMLDPVIDPEHLDSISPAAVPEIVERLRKQAEESQKALEERREEAQKQLKQALNKMRVDFPDADIGEPGEIVGPPKFDPNHRSDEIAQGIEQLEGEHFDGQQMREALLGADMRKLLFGAQQAFFEFYRQGAHLQTPAPAKQRNDGLREQFVAAIRSGRSFDKQDWTGTNLSGMDLSNADLSGIFLESADLSNCNLSNARLEKAVLANADLTAAVLDGTRFNSANLGRCLLNEARAVNADFADAVFAETDFSGASLEGCRFGRIRLSELKLDDVVLRRCDFGGALLLDRDLKDVELSESRLDDAKLIRSSIDGGNLESASLNGATLVGCRMSNCNLARAKLENFRVVMESSFTRCDFGDASLPGSNLGGSRFEECRFDRADLSGGQFRGIIAKGASFARCNAARTSFVSADLRETSWVAANLMESSLERADLRHGDFRAANLFGADLARVHVVIETNFEGALTRRMRTWPRKFDSREGT